MSSAAMANAIAARRAAPAEPSEVVEALVALKRQFASDLAAAKATHAEQLADREAQHSAREAQHANENTTLRSELVAARNELREAYTRIEVYRQALQGCAAAEGPGVTAVVHRRVAASTIVSPPSSDRSPIGIDGA